ncbi:ABC transporter substrate-binding protein [Vibrio sp. SCSIO 43137]|uniref:ABC transporter substrate-binding protein n=1 Tax=Vibrio sp. SCSIO 43137 TaxID=3021011 RepID=UPI0023071CF1|nr:ABC transporter substrate-binding protein [Vibrio sp. SCSIO 43137]WCE31914.1 ABC transporter substrate-binding protein [Vibrio sp. SCSIO 43137]WCE31920.1 ABC transporter substrate-binding protein [Vibrio sp. SCSIO 43137]
MKSAKLTLLAALAVVGLGTAQAKDEMYIPVVSKGYQHEFWQTVKLGSDTAAKELGVKTSFVGPAAETQISEQIQLMEDMMARQPDAILLAALDSNALVVPVEDAKSRGIEIATFDSGINSDIPKSFIATNNVKAGADAAKTLGKMLGGEGKVGIIAHVAGTQNAMERSNGFIDEMAKSYPNIKVLEVQYSDGDPQKAMDKTIDMVRANPDLSAVYATNEGSTLGVANAIDSLGLAGKVKVMGFDSTEGIIAFLKAGTIQGFVVQDAYQIGYQGLKTLYNVLDGKKVAGVIDIPVKVVTAENIDSPDMQQLLYPFGK